MHQFLSLCCNWRCCEWGPVQWWPGAVPWRTNSAWKYSDHVSGSGEVKSLQPAICWQGNEFSKVLHNRTVEQVCFEAGEAEKLSALAFLSFQRQNESRVKPGRLNTCMVKWNIGISIEIWMFLLLILVIVVFIVPTSGFCLCPQYWSKFIIYFHCLMLSPSNW